jgi:hypothetical protein
LLILEFGLGGALRVFATVMGFTTSRRGPDVKDVSFGERRKHLAAHPLDERPSRHFSCIA